jgi:hypothetical protein
VFTKRGPVPVSWTRGSLTAGFPQGEVGTRLEPPDESATTTRTDIVSAFTGMTHRFNRFRELADYRYRLTKYALLLLLAQEAFLFSCRRWLGKSVFALRLIASGAWILGGVYLAYGFLQ